MGYLKDNFVGYISRNKKWVIFLAVCLIVIFLSSMIASGIQSDGWKVEVTDLRDAENEGTITVTSYDSETQQPVTEVQDVEGKVVSGILFKPDTATAENPAPAVVFTHGYLNNREMQLQNAIELARRGFVVLAVDREGHGNYENSGSQSAMMATSGLYDSAKYLYNLDYVDKDKIGISGHSMGGFTTAMTLMQDASVGIVSAGLIQSWSTFLGAGSDVSVGFLKSVDDEFFYTTNENGGTISREWLSTETAKGLCRHRRQRRRRGQRRHLCERCPHRGRRRRGSSRCVQSHLRSARHPSAGTLFRGRRGGCHQLLLHRVRHSRRQRLHRGKQPDLVGEGNVLLHRHDRALRVHLPAGQPAAHHPLLPLSCGEERGEICLCSRGGTRRSTCGSACG